MKYTLLFACLVGTIGATDNRVVCPTDASILGYTSINDLNLDIMQEFQFDLIETDPSLVKKTSHVYYLCPNTVFEGEQRLTPLLNNSAFVCGADGSSHQNCTISGGHTQLNIVEYPGSQVEYLSFSGITFSGAEDYGVAALLQAGSIAEFFDCHWRNGGGTSAVHIHYEPYLIESIDALHPYIEGLSPPQDDIATAEQLDNIFEHRRLTEEASGMTVKIYNSSFSDSRQDNYRAIFNSGDLYMYNVTVRDMQGGIMTNIMSGNATIVSCEFDSLEAVSVIRAVNSSNVVVRNSVFSNNQVVGIITSVGSNVTVSECEFHSNDSPRGGEVLAFWSNVTLQDSCIFGSNSLSPVFRGGNSRVLAMNVYGEDLKASVDHCVAGPGIFLEDPGSSCFTGDECSGHCETFKSVECTVPSRLPDPSLVSSAVAAAYSILSIGVLTLLVAGSSI